MIWIKTTLDGTVANQPAYEHFRTDYNCAKNLTYLVKTDPFFASALTNTHSGFELRSFDRKYPDAKDEIASLFRNLLSNLDSPGHRVNISFDSDMEITSYRVYDVVTGSRIFQFGGEKYKKIDDWASSAVYKTFLYAEAVHATIHVFHYLSNSAFQYQVLMHTNGENLKRYNAIITGVNGFGAEPSPTMTVLSDLMNQWSQSSTASSWVDGMMNISRKDMKSKATRKVSQI
ncbi:hypothetical protein FRACYDRAFT_236406 [Fragilariopsis cylindrus CCMP1102]|uniref:Uncharacterized protein n=1 Tax=Fragilariopsis cylindrus CCMP1102 TaxID=635003 RepID=A0A1E7FQ91_9STRA|nr:hypothetical protein FRACYDRAFT_236406 [Fragilariopsis cylindrus CCMP1102]|eukprot:OEU20332.1 hypothetical protein FRACYDRAFT_236406 [Fragilariopsis cylindrus CCMP1102]